MRTLFPEQAPGDPGDHYAYAPAPTRPWVRGLMVCSADGAVSGGGRSAGVATRADRRVFGRLRRAADVVLAGAGTVRAEDYRGIRGDAPPPVAVVTGSADLDPGSRLFTDTAVAPVVLTTAAAPADRRAALARAGGDVAVLHDLSPASLLAELDRRGLRRVLCEGGPTLLGALVAADALDELCLTLTPLLTAGPAGRIAVSPQAVHREMTLASVLEEDGSLLLRYLRPGDPRH